MKHKRTGKARSTTTEDYDDEGSAIFFSVDDDTKEKDLDVDGWASDGMRSCDVVICSIAMGTTGLHLYGDFLRALSRSHLRGEELGHVL